MSKRGSDKKQEAKSAISEAKTGTKKTDLRDNEIAKFLINSNEKLKNTPINQPLALIIVIVVLLIVCLFQFQASREFSMLSPKESNLEKPDINGLVIKEACETVREKGWSVSGIDLTGDSSTKSDCSDDKHRVSSYYYSSDDTVSMHYTNNTKDDSSKTDTSSASSSESKNTGSTNSNSTNKSTGSSSSSSTSSSSSSSSTDYWSDMAAHNGETVTIEGTLKVDYAYGDAINPDKKYTNCMRDSNQMGGGWVKTDKGTAYFTYSSTGVVKGGPCTGEKVKVTGTISVDESTGGVLWLNVSGSNKVEKN